MARSWLLPVIYGFVFLIVSSICVEALSEEVIVEPTKLWRFLGNNEEAVQQRFRENIEEFSVGRIKCLRYCIEGSTFNDAPHILHLTWKLKSKRVSEMRSAVTVDKDITPQIMHEKSIMPIDSQNLRNRCTFSIVMGCESLPSIGDKFTDTEKKFIHSLKPNLDVLDDSKDNTSPALNFVNESIVDKSNLANLSEIEFHVESNQAEVSAIILGNISRIDLKMPIGNTTEKPAAEPRLTLALSRMRVDEENTTTALRLNVLNPPPGGWKIGLKGVDVKRIVVTSAVIPEFTSSETSAFEFSAGNEHENARAVLPIKNEMISRKIHVVDEPMERSNRAGEISVRMITDNRSEDQDGEQRPFRFPIFDSDSGVVDPNRTITTRMNTDMIEDRMIDRDAIEINDFTRSLNDELPIKKNLIVEVNPDTNLIAQSASVHRVTFDITNNHPITVRHYFEATSSTFRILGIRPVWGYVEIVPRQTVNVAVDVQIPPNIAETVVNTITLRVQGIENMEKTVNIYVRTPGHRIYDDVRPDIDVYYNNNCAWRTSAEKCLKSYWSVDIIVQDSDSGLKSVVSTPRGVYPRSSYSSGTSSPVYFYYSSNCCNRVVEITATDVAGNVYSRRIDVGVWYNLMAGEVLAIVLGTLFIILLIVLIVITILYCKNRRESHDLPYSQRYGSRSAPTRSE